MESDITRGHSHCDTQALFYFSIGTDPAIEKLV